MAWYGRHGLAWHGMACRVGSVGWNARTSAAGVCLGVLRGGVVKFPFCSRQHRFEVGGVVVVTFSEGLLVYAPCASVNACLQGFEGTEDTLVRAWDSMWLLSLT